MTSPLRSMGLRLRKYILPLTGFWDLFFKLEDVRERMARLELATGASGERITQIQDRISQSDAGIVQRLDVLTEALAARDGALIATVAAEVDRLDGYLAYHVRTLHELGAAIRADHAAALCELGVAIRADHAAALQENVATVRSDLDPMCKSLQVITSRPQHSSIVPGVDVLMVTSDRDLIVPTAEPGLLAYILRHGLAAIEPGVQAILRDHLKPGAVAVDAGANVGIHSIGMASAVGPTGCVVCFEPLPHLAKALERTLQLNGFSDRAQVQQMALSDTIGEATLHRAAHGPMSSLYALPEGMETEVISVPVVTLDRYFAPGARVDFVKMDVEGAEPRMWRGMRRVLQDNPGIIVILEWSASHFRRTGENPTSFMADIRASGFTPFIISDDGSAGRLTQLRGGMDAVEAKNLLLVRRPIAQDAVDATEGAVA